MLKKLMVSVFAVALLGSSAIPAAAMAEGSTKFPNGDYQNVTLKTMNAFVMTEGPDAGWCRIEMSGYISDSGNFPEQNEGSENGLIEITDFDFGGQEEDRCKTNHGAGIGIELEATNLPWTMEFSPDEQISFVQDPSFVYTAYSTSSGKVQWQCNNVVTSNLTGEFTNEHSGPQESEHTDILSYSPFEGDFEQKGWGEGSCAYDDLNVFWFTTSMEAVNGPWTEPLEIYVFPYD